MASYLPGVTDIFPDPALFTPDFSFMDKMLRRKQMQYEQGFAALNNQYGNINKDLTNPFNANIRNQFLRSAQNNLKNLSAMDLSQQQNVDAAAQVFQPFYKNTAVLGDQALTAHWNQQESLAESFRLKDGGKEFSEDNINYVRQQKQQFAGDNPDTWQSYYANKRSFTPYYDWNKEVADRMKEFKPSETKIEKINGMYTVTTADKSWTEQEISRYLDSTLSDKSKQQMKIEASVRIGSNPTLLATGYMANATTALSGVNNALSRLDDKIKVEKDPANLALLKENREYYADKQNELATNIKNIQEGNLDFLKRNGDALAYNMYYNASVSKLSKGFSHRDIEQTLGYNQVAMMYYREGQENWRATMKEDRADAREANKAKGTPATPIPITEPGEEVNTGLSNLKDAQRTAETVAANLQVELKDHIATMLGGTNSARSLSEDQVSRYVNDHPTDPVVRKYFDANSMVESTKDRVANWTKDAEDYARKQMGEKDYNDLLTYREVVNKQYNAIAPSWKDKQYNDTYMGQTGQERDLLGSKISAAIQANKTLGPDIKRGAELEKTFGNLTGKYNSTLNTNSSANRTGFTYSTGTKQYENALGSLEAVTGVDKSKISAIRWIPSPTGTDMKFSVDNKSSKDPVDMIAVGKRMQTQFPNSTISLDDNTGTITVKNLGSTVSPGLDPYYGVNPNARSMMLALETTAGSPGGKRDGSPFVMQGQGIQRMFTIRKTFGNTTEGDKYYLMMEGMPDNQPVAPPFGNILQAYGTAAQLINDPTGIDIIIKSKKH